MTETSGLHSSELAKLPHDPNDPNEDIWELTMVIRILREQMEDFEKEWKEKLEQQMATLEGLLYWCDSLLYQSCELYSRRAQEKKDFPDSP